MTRTNHGSSSCASGADMWLLVILYGRYASLWRWPSPGSNLVQHSFAPRAASHEGAILPMLGGSFDATLDPSTQE